MNLMSQAEYARQRNRAKSLITRYVKDGRIVLVDRKVDPEQADKALGFTKVHKAHNEEDGDKKNESGDYWKEKTRRESAEASLKELDLSRRQGELVEVDVVAQEFSKMVDAVRQQLLSIPTKIAPTVHAQKTIHAIHRIIEDAIHDALNDFGTYNAESGKPRTGRAPSKNRSASAKVKTNAKAKRQRVGK